MSGEAGASRKSEYYSLFVGSGINVAIAAPPGEDPSAAASQYFERANKPFAGWLTRAASALDALFEHWRQRLPLAPIEPEGDQLWCAVIDDRPAEASRSGTRERASKEVAAWFAVHPDGKLRVFRNDLRLRGLEHAALEIAVCKPVYETDLVALEAEVMAVIESAREEPKHSPPNDTPALGAPSDKPVGWLGRLLRRRRGEH